jgi:hypothetical protein
MSLQVYTRKRNFTNTPEPSGKSKKKSAALSFVMMRHDFIMIFVYRSMVY